MRIDIASVMCGAALLCVGLTLEACSSDEYEDEAQSQSSVSGAGGSCIQDNVKCEYIE